MLLLSPRQERQKLEDRNWTRATMARPFPFSILYSAECVEGRFREVHLQYAAKHRSYRPQSPYEPTPKRLSHH